MKAGLIPEGRFHSWSQISFLEPGFIPGGFHQGFLFWPGANIPWKHRGAGSAQIP